MTNLKTIVATLSLSIAALAAGRSDAAPAVPAFQPESITDFQAALHQGHQRARPLDAVHRDETHFHAYRFVDPEMVLIGVASAVTVDANGRLHILQAHGQPMAGHPNRTHSEFSHILLPAGVKPPGR